jgi:outer membrane protein assembly factor BamB
MAFDPSTRMREASMTRLVLLSGLLLVGSTTKAAAESEPTAFELRWKLQSSGLWPPAISGDRLVVKTGETVAAYSVSSGRLLWTRRLDNLKLGEGTVAAGERYVYLLGSGGLELLDLQSGQPAGKRALSDPTGLLFQGGSLYVSDGAGLLRLDESGSKLLQKATGFRGELRGADGDHVAIFRHQPSSDGKASPKRLTVVNLRTGKVAFEFKLLPTGAHQVARMGEGRISFIDYTVGRPSPGKPGTDDAGNPRKLYYTEADYVRGKKIRDISLSAKYTSTRADVFWIAVAPSGRVFLANHGRPGDPSTLFAFDPEQGKTLWTRSGEVASMGLALHQDRLWTGVTGNSGEGLLVAYNPETGDVISRLPLDAAGTGAPALAGSSLLVRTRSSIYCLAPHRPVPLEGRPAAVTWRMFRDRVAGYLIQVPDTWRFNRQSMRKLGGPRFVIPFERRDPNGGAGPLATVHILTWEAAGRDAQALWRSVYAQRVRSHPQVKVLSLVRVPAQGGSGPPALIASYTFRKAGGEPVEMRSLCVISHNIAFELRGWVAPAAHHLWAEVEGIFKSFQPRPPGSL